MNPEPRYPLPSVVSMHFDLKDRVKFLTSVGDTDIWVDSGYTSYPFLLVNSPGSHEWVHIHRGFSPNRMVVSPEVLEFCKNYHVLMS